jgi:hypothetical protein
MLETVIVVIAGVGGAWLMTVFLRLVNHLIPYGLRVPLILAQVVHHYFNGAPLYNVKHKNKYGHALHLLVGLFFAFCYSSLWRRDIGGFTLEDILLFGLVSGLVGMAGWFVFLRATYEPEQVNEAVFFPVIVIAHVPFAFGVTVIYYGLWSLLTG